MESLSGQVGAPAYEVIIVEDGSTLPCQSVVEEFAGLMPVKYKVKENGGPAQARNYGAQYAAAPWLIILDSDVILPPGYLNTVATALGANPACALFGGPDAASPHFTPVQKAVNYAMTSVLTTGGIRGQKTATNKRFYPRSFNMGCRKALFDAVGGFDAGMRFGEDIDFSLRCYQAGASVALFREAFVYHKRRVDLKKFFKQVFNSGMARIDLTLRHPASLKAVYMLPSGFVIALVIGLVALWFIPVPLLSLLALFLLVIWADAWRSSRNLKVALLAIPAVFTQLIGYGSGFLYAGIRYLFTGKRHANAFSRSFYQ